MTEGLTSTIVVQRSKDFSVDIELAVGRAQVLALVGPNGSGKSTVVAALAGLLPVTAGIIQVDGNVLDDPVSDTFVQPRHRRFGVAFQTPRLFGHMSVRANIDFAHAARRTNSGHSAAKTAELIEAFGVVDLLDLKPGQLSGGQAQLVSLVRALASDPRLLLLDEPFSALDAALRGQVREALRRWLDNFDGPTVIISHDAVDAFALADEVAVLERGRRTQLGRPDDIRRRPATSYAASLTGTNRFEADAVAGTLQMSGCPISIQTWNVEVSGGVIASIPAEAIALYNDRPSGSPRNTWHTQVETVTSMGSTVRVTVGAPLPLSIDVTPSAVTDLSLKEGSPVWASVKATEVDVTLGRVQQA